MRPQRAWAAAIAAASVRLLGHVGLAGGALPALLSGHRRRLLGGCQVAVDREDLGPFLDEAQHGRTPVPHPFAGALAGADDDGDLSLQTHF